MEVAALTPLGNPAVTCCMYCTKRLRYVTTLLCIFKTKHLEITQQNIKMNSILEVFSSFGIDCIQMCGSLGQSLDNLLPDDIDYLRYEHIENLLQIVSEESNWYHALQTMLTPRQNLIPDGLLSKQIWRFVDFVKKDETAYNTISRALVLRESDILFDIETELVIPQPKLMPGYFKGTSCFLKCPCIPHALLGTLDFFPTRSELESQITQLKKLPGVKKVRAAVAIYLEKDVNISVDDWIVDADDIDPGHVTIAVANKVGLPASQPELSTHKVCIPQLNALSWTRLENKVFLYKAEAEWRDDYFTDGEEWRNVICVLNKILIEGDFDAFSSIWSIHLMVHRDKVGMSVQDIQHDMLDVLKHIHQVLINFECSDEYDMNIPGRELERAIESVNQLICKVSSI